MKILYFDCSSGISGDMTVAALTDLGVPVKYLKDELKKLQVNGLEIEFSTVVKNGISANSANVSLTGKADLHVHRHYSDIIKLIDESGITEGAKGISKSIFGTIACAEAKVHGTAVANVHFHEVGAWDSIADVVGTGICVDYLKPDKIMASVINEGYGFSYCQHGKIPVPVPAVVEIFSAKHVKFNQIDIEGELVTPTGAGIVAALAESFSAMRNTIITKTGYGAGNKDLSIPNVLRVHMCESDLKAETVTVIETNIDDQTPEMLAYAMERLMDAGALDVFFTPIQMKKNRPAMLLTVICDNDDMKKLSEIIFINTTTFGIRYKEVNRICLERNEEKVHTPYGDVSVKIGYWNNTKKVSPEYESAKAIAQLNNVPINEIYKSIYKYKS